jgi:hypothetical protein
MLILLHNIFVDLDLVRNTFVDLELVPNTFHKFWCIIHQYLWCETEEMEVGNVPNVEVGP